jgi:hypothetical protein
MTLSDRHLVLLSAAAQRPDGLLIPPANLKAAPLKAMRQKLIKLGLVAEVPVRRDQPAWFAAEEGRFGLRITSAGYEALGLQPEPAEAPQDGPTSSAVLPRPEPSPPRPRSKIDAVLALLRRNGGASLADLAAATGWLPHTIRAALTGLRKKGHAIELATNAAGERVYRLIARQPDATPADAGKKGMR